MTSLIKEIIYSYTFYIYFSLFLMILGLYLYGILYLRNKNDSVNDRIIIFDTSESLIARIILQHGIMICSTVIILYNIK
jgi:hypothetical protein